MPDTDNTTDNQTQFLSKVRDSLLVPETSKFRRPIDILYLTLGIAAFLVASLMILIQRDIIRDADVGLFRYINVYALPDVIVRALFIIMQAGSLVAVPIFALIAALAKRFILARNLMLGGTAAWFLNKVFKALLLRGRPMDLLENINLRNIEPAGLGFPSGHATIAATLATVAHPYLRPPLRLISWGIVALVAITRIYFGAHFPLDVVGGVALGLIIGSIVNIISGVPKTTLAKDAIREAFADYGLSVDDVTKIHGDARGSDPHLASTEAGQKYFVKVVGRDHRNADFIFKVFRSAIFKNTGPNTPYLSPQQQIEHEAFLVLMAQEHGVRTAEVEFTTAGPDGYALLVQQGVEGRHFSELDAEEITDDLIHDIWIQVKRLHEARIAHRDLRAENILVDDSGSPWIIDFGFSVAGADENARGVDIAQLLALLARSIGVERTVDSALEVLSTEEVVHAIPALQPLLISSEKSDEDDATDVLDELREAIAERTATEEAEDESVLRVQPQTLLWVFGLGIGIYLLFPQLAELGAVADAWRQANPLLLAAALAGSVASYLMAALQQQGAVRQSVSYLHNTIAHLAATFANRLGPRGAGGMVVMARFLENVGLKRRSAIASLGLKTAAGAIIHIAGLLLVVAVIGTTQFENIPIVSQVQENWQLIVGGLLGIGLIVAFLWKPFDLEQYLDPIKKSLRDLRRTLKRPVKAAELLGGSIGVTLAYILTLALSMWAVGASPSLLIVAVVFLAGDLVGSASPTPGGLGVIESAFAAGFTAFGVPAGQAIAGVLLYRLLTFWLPIPFGFVAFRYLQKKDYL